MVRRYEPKDLEKIFQDLEDENDRSARSRTRIRYLFAITPAAHQEG